MDKSNHGVYPASISMDKADHGVYAASITSVEKRGVGNMIVGVQVLLPNTVLSQSLHKQLRDSLELLEPRALVFNHETAVS